MAARIPADDTQALNAKEAAKATNGGAGNRAPKKGDA
ncbi:unnamed protein product, partial [Clonostachys rosea]